MEKETLDTNQRDTFDLERFVSHLIRVRNDFLCPSRYGLSQLDMPCGANCRRCWERALAPLRKDTKDEL